MKGEGKRNTRENKYDEHKKRYSTQHTALSANILIGWCVEFLLRSWNDARKSAWEIGIDDTMLAGCCCCANIVVIIAYNTNSNYNMNICWNVFNVFVSIFVWVCVVVYCLWIHFITSLFVENSKSYFSSTFEACAFDTIFDNLRYCFFLFFSFHFPFKFKGNLYPVAV